MDYQEQLMSKNGLAVKYIAREFLGTRTGEKTATISELCAKFNLARGTVQGAIRTLEANSAIQITRHGHMGSTLTRKNDRILFQCAGLEMLIGAMPLPYSRRYEGLATGLMSAAGNADGIPIILSYMRGAKNRIAMVTQKRYDFAIVSKYAVNIYERENPGRIRIVLEFGRGTYCSSHVVLFHDKDAGKIRPGMKIGIDRDSFDQAAMTRDLCQGIDVSYANVQYSSLLKRVLDGDLDAAVWNLDEIIDRAADINYQEIDIGGDDTNAVIICSADEPAIAGILSQIIEKETVLRLQTLVEEGAVTPSY